eukprot:m.230721 g.230721  ORF g.230721 m.230721 type:complete len:60 (-) comp33587_c1_seq3:469-648(-)
MSSTSTTIRRFNESITVSYQISQATCKPDIATNQTSSNNLLPGCGYSTSKDTKLSSTFR